MSYPIQLLSGITQKRFRNPFINKVIVNRRTESDYQTMLLVLGKSCTGKYLVTDSQLQELKDKISKDLGFNKKIPFMIKLNTEGSAINSKSLMSSYSIYSRPLLISLQLWNTSITITCSLKSNKFCNPIINQNRKLSIDDIYKLKTFGQSWAEQIKTFLNENPDWQLFKGVPRIKLNIEDSTIEGFFVRTINNTKLFRKFSFSDNKLEVCYILNNIPI